MDDVGFYMGTEFEGYKESCNRWLFLNSSPSIIRLYSFLFTTQQRQFFAIFSAFTDSLLHFHFQIAI